MISADDIRLLVQAGEGYNAEFKKAIPAKVKDISEEVCAFANAAGGTVLIGVDDQNRLVGVKVDNARRSALQNSLSEITPHLSCQHAWCLIHYHYEGESVLNARASWQVLPMGEIAE